MLLGFWVVTDQPNPKGERFPLCPQPPSPNLPVSDSLNAKLSFSARHLFWALECSGSEISFQWSQTCRAHMPPTLPPSVHSASCSPHVLSRSVSVWLILLSCCVHSYLSMFVCLSSFVSGCVCVCRPFVLCLNLSSSFPLFMTVSLSSFTLHVLSGPLGVRVCVFPLYSPPPAPCLFVSLCLCSCLSPALCPTLPCAGLQHSAECMHWTERNQKTGVSPSTQPCTISMPLKVTFALLASVSSLAKQRGWTSRSLCGGQFLSLSLSFLVAQPTQFSKASASLFPKI